MSVRAAGVKTGRIERAKARSAILAPGSALGPGPGNVNARAMLRPRRRPLQSRCRGRASRGRNSLQEANVRDRGTRFAQQELQFFGECFPLVMLLLSRDVTNYGGDATETDGERSEAALPAELAFVGITNQDRRRLLQLADDCRNRLRWIEAREEVQVIFDTTDVNVFESQVPRGAREVRVE